MIRPLYPDETRVGLAGDWERNAPWARRCLHALADRDVQTVFQLGDFGIQSGGRGRQYVSEIDGTLRGFGQALYVTPGNHDDYTQISELPVLDDGLQWLTEHIAILPRGHRWEMAGRTWISLGGAPSVDFPSRIDGETWWPEEAITDNDVQRVIDGGPADVMLCHDSPSPGTPAVARIIRTGGGWTAQGLRYAREGRARLTRAFEAIQPSLLAHGHYHVADQAVLPVAGTDRSCRVLSLAADAMWGNLGVLDLADPAEITWEWLDVGQERV